jgi:hypothetical protein
MNKGRSRRQTTETDGKSGRKTTAEGGEEVMGGSAEVRTREKKKEKRHLAGER